MLKSFVDQKHDELVEVVKKSNKLDIGTTTSNDHKITRVSLRPEYKFDQGKIVRLNKRLKFFTKIVKSEYTPTRRGKQW